MDINEVLILESIKLLKEDALEIEKIKNVITPHYTIAIEALKKQLGGKPEYTRWCFFKCPSCSKEFPDGYQLKHYPFCLYCGQKLKW